MTKEKTLSDTVYEGRWFHIGHVAEAVKKLKDEMVKWRKLGWLTENQLLDHKDLIDKIFGRFDAKEKKGWEMKKIRELKCVYCRKGCGQTTHDGMLPFLGHFVCSECFERKRGKRR